MNLVKMMKDQLFLLILEEKNVDLEHIQLKLHLFVQKVTQVDGEGVAASQPEKCYILNVK